MFTYRVYNNPKVFLKSFRKEQEAIQFALAWAKENNSHALVFKGAMIGRNGKMRPCYAFTHKTEDEYRIYF